MANQTNQQSALAEVQVAEMGDLSSLLRKEFKPRTDSAEQAVEQAVKSVAGVTDARVELTWDPPWSREKMSEAARLQLGMI